MRQAWEPLSNFVYFFSKKEDKRGSIQASVVAATKHCVGFADCIRGPVITPETPWNQKRRSASSNLLKVVLSAWTPVFGHDRIDIAKGQKAICTMACHLILKSACLSPLGLQQTEHQKHNPKSSNKHPLGPHSDCTPAPSSRCIV